MIKKLISLIILVPTILLSETSTFDSTYYATFLKTGIPANIPIELINSHYAQIDGGKYFKYIYLVVDSTAKFDDNAQIVYSRTGIGYGRMSVEFIKVDNDISKAEKLFLTSDEDELDKLELFLLPVSNVLLYKWGKKVNMPTPRVRKEYPYKKGKDFPPLIIETEEDTINTKDFLGKICVINWWATSCHGCVLEIPGLNKLVTKYKDEDVVFVSIIWDKENFEQFIDKHPFHYLHGFSNKKLEKIFGLGFPRNLILDKNGMVLYNKPGGSPDTYKLLDKVITEVIK